MAAERRGQGDSNQTLADLMPTGQCFQVLRDGVPVAAYLLRVRDDEAFILAAAGRDVVDLTIVIDALVTIQARQAGLATVAFRTVRPGLKKKVVALGYVLQGDILRKRIGP